MDKTLIRYLNTSRAGLAMDLTILISFPISPQIESYEKSNNKLSPDPL